MSNTSDNIILDDNDILSVRNRDLYVYDKEFVKIVDSFRSLVDSFNSVLHRWKRAETISISKNVFDYSQTILNHIKLCDVYYRFSCGSRSFFIQHYKNTFILRAVDIPLNYFSSSNISLYGFFIDNKSSDVLSGVFFKSFNEAYSAYLSCLNDIIFNFKLDLSGDLLINDLS
ncbi:hypothetical protein [Capybara microvirus Cap3_SP_316]|nr:hypothetical protein [Capybara microvirus Cap3_SP_316]